MSNEMQQNRSAAALAGPAVYRRPALYLLYPCSWTLTAFAEILYFVHCYKQSMALFKEPQAA